MKRMTLITSIIFVLTIIFYQPAFSQLLNNPESVEYDPVRDVHLVSNFGDGSIVEIDSDGNQSYFDTTLTRLAGIHIKDGILYAAANLAPYNGIYGFDLATAEMVFSVDIPSIGLLNDVSTDTSGYLYVSDYYDHKLFKVDLENQTYSLFVDTILFWPNGIVFDSHENRILVLSVAAAGQPIHSVNLEDSTVTVAVYTNITGLDGVTFDSYHRLYLSSWTTEAVHRYGPDLSGSPVIFSTGHNDPADIFIDSNNILCVPNFYWNTVDFVQIEPVSIDDDLTSVTIPVEFVLYPNYPNPFNSSTTFSFYIPVAGDVSVNIFDITGRVVDTFIASFPTAGHHQYVWNPEGLSSGAYFYKIASEDWEAVRKLTYLK